jgi:AraC family transcriptional regulator
MNKKTYSDNEYAKRIHRALDYVQEHLDEEINLEAIASEACFSQFHFHRIFTAMLGETPHDYIERLRLEKAANMLFSPKSQAITEIAYKCGFSSPSVFSRAFKKHFGLSASAFIKKHIEDYHSLNRPEQKISHLSNSLDYSKITIKKLPAFHLAYARCYEGYSNGIGETWNKIFKYAYAHELINDDTQAIGIPFDNPGITPEKKCRYYACVTAPESIMEISGEIGILDVKEGKYVVYHFYGKAEEISVAYSELYGIWLPQSGYIPDEKPALEIYPKRRNENNDIFEYDIALPIKPL